MSTGSKHARTGRFYLVMLLDAVVVVVMLVLASSQRQAFWWWLLAALWAVVGIWRAVNELRTRRLDKPLS